MEVTRTLSAETTLISKDTQADFQGPVTPMVRGLKRRGDGGGGVKWNKISGAGKGNREVIEWMTGNKVRKGRSGAKNVMMDERISGGI